MKNRKILPVHFIPLSFLLAIVLGTLFLKIPFATAAGEHTDFLTALFTATTSVCVTGLVVVDTYSHWSALGQLIILLLVQIGGLGVVSVASMIMLIGKRKFSLGDRILLEDSLNIENKRGLLAFLSRVFRGVFLTEGIGALLYATWFVPRLGFVRGLWTSIFLSVSAFCNAGMDVMGPNSLMEYSGNGMILYVTMALIVLGGLGFVVWFDLIDGIKKSLRQ
ncbi:MAG: potassium transporter TrkH, partial [Lachnospiraceae bacterium]|nr:potassium transporter TrkH [Lachnospiraceae bacterium]